MKRFHKCSDILQYTNTDRKASGILVQEVYVHQLVNVNESMKILSTEFVFTQTPNNSPHPTPYDVEESLGLLQR